MGGRVGSIQSVLEQLLRGAQEEVAIAAYSIRSSADLVLDWMEAALARGVKVAMVVNRIPEQASDVVARLEGMARKHQWLSLYSFTADGHGQLHAKLVVVDRRTALIGSSNLSRHGLLDNHEMAVLTTGDPAETAAGAFDALLASTLVTRYPAGM
jgi:cardiolipin synthase